MGAALVVGTAVGFGAGVFFCKITGCVNSQPDEMTADNNTVEKREDEMPADKNTVEKREDEMLADDNTVEKREDEMPADKNTVEKREDKMKADKNTEEKREDKMKADKNTVEKREDKMKAEKNTVEKREDKMKAEKNTEKKKKQCNHKNSSRVRSHTPEKTELGSHVEQLLAKADKTEEHMKKLLSAVEAFQSNPHIPVLELTDKSSRQNNIDSFGEGIKDAASALGFDPQQSGAILMAVECGVAVAVKECIQRILDVDLKNIQKERALLNKKRLDLDATKSSWKRATPAAQATVEPQQLVTAQAEFDKQLDIVRTLLEALEPGVNEQIKRICALIEPES